MSKERKELLEVRNLKMYFSVKNDGLFKPKKQLKAVDGVSFTIYQGETLGLVGESGCGKSTTGKLIVKILHPTDGQIIYKGKDIVPMSKKEFREMRKEIQMIFQDPYSSLDPRRSNGKTIEEPLEVNKIKGNTKEKVLGIMKEVGLREEFYDRYPHEFSGGQRQRVGIARALALNPKLIVCDEPVSALDVSIQAQILNLMRELQKAHNLTYLFISHDLSVVKHISDRITVMYLGGLVELADKKELFDHPLHPYTKALLESVPVPDPEKRKEQGKLKGDVPSPIDPPEGCTFHTRCNQCMDICKENVPEFKEIEKNHFVKCFLYNRNE
jgi:oligopeptide/dipeptide ABC transporter ATP-binding protein